MQRGFGLTTGLRSADSMTISPPQQTVWVSLSTQLSLLCLGMGCGNYHLCEERMDVQWHRAIWNSRGIPRHNLHSWLVVQDRLPTRDRLIRWGLQVDQTCLLCNVVSESRDHLFFDCNFSFQLWSLSAARIPIAPHRSWAHTILQMSSLPPPQATRLLTLLTWQSTLYWVWNERNTRLHTNTFRSIETIYTLIDRQIKNKIQSFKDSNPTRSSQMMHLWFQST